MNIRRILVGLDASAHSLAALEAVAEMAAGLEAQLMGVFVEDVNLLRLAALPFARELGYPSASPRPLDAGAMQRSLRAAAERAERALAGAATKKGVTWTFRVTRGAVAEELLAAAREADLLALGKTSHDMGSPLRLGSTALDLLSRAAGALLFLQEGVPIRTPVVVLFDGGTSSEQALAVAVNLARNCRGALLVLTVGSTIGAVRRCDRRAKALVEDIVDAPPVQFGTRVYRSFKRLLQAVEAAQPGVLVTPSSIPALEHGDLVKLAGGIPCPVFVVR